MNRGKTFIAILMFLSLTLVACRTSNQATIESESSAGASISPIQESSVINTIIIANHLTQPYFALFASRRYTILYHYTALHEGQLEEREMTAAIDGEQELIRITSSNMDTSYLTKDGKNYEIDHLNRTIRESEAEAVSKEGCQFPLIELLPFKDAGVTFEGSGEEDGLSYVEYYTANGERMFYYFEGDIMKRVRSTSRENEFSIDVINVKNITAPELFELPEDYEWIS